MITMEDPGEQLVGEYLKEVKDCEFIAYNIKTTDQQGEIDVVGIDTKAMKIYLCEVATHLETGIQYTKNNRPDNVDRMTKKFKKDSSYAKKFPEYTPIFMLWTPIVRIPKKINPTNNQEQDLLTIKKRLKQEKNINLDLICNEKFLSCIEALELKVSNKTEDLKSPISRYIQIKTKLQKHVELLKKRTTQQEKTL